MTLPNDPPRKYRGRTKKSVAMPVPMPQSAMPAYYDSLVAEIKQRVAAERIRTLMSANSAMVLLYWDIGQAILARQHEQGWGVRVIG